LPHTNPSNQWP